MTKLSIVTTLYYSEPFLEEFLQKAIRAAENICKDFEILLVDDGSPDNSLNHAISFAVKNDRIKVIELSRNFGHHAAILAGLEHTSGELIFLVDSDLEEPPELLIEFHKTLLDTSADVVFGVHEQKTGGLFRRFTSGLYWQLFNVLSNVKVSPNICHVRLMTRRYLNSLLSLPDKNIFLGGLYAWPGFVQIPRNVDRRIQRKKSTYSPIKRIQLFATSIIAFSIRPLVVIFFIGVFISALAFSYGAFLGIYKLLNPNALLSGFASLMIAIVFFSGINMAVLGIIGLYIGQIYNEVKGRPRYVIRSTCNLESET